MLTQDDIYQGYFLPKGTIFLTNVWAIHRDEEKYDNPYDFVPERWLNNKFGTKNPVQDNKDQRRVHYGWGRRAYAGQRLAENFLVSVHYAEKLSVC